MYMDSSDQLIVCQKWPQLNANELIELYNEININKKLKISDIWCNPGRIDPKLFLDSTKLETKNEYEKGNLILNQNEFEKEKQTSPLPNQNNKFNICDEFLNEDDQEKNEIFKVENEELISNKLRRDINAKKIACIDKIFDDMRKNYEINSKQFDDDDFNLENSNNVNQKKEQQNYQTEKQQQDLDEEPKLANNNIDNVIDNHNELFNLDHVSLINKHSKEETFSDDMCNTSANNENNNNNIDYLKQQHALNIISNDTLMARLKEDEEEFINHRKNNFNNLQSDNDIENVNNEHPNDMIINSTLGTSSYDSLD
jgi:hypothetical protein